MKQIYGHKERLLKITGYYWGNYPACKTERQSNKSERTVKETWREEQETTNVSSKNFRRKWKNR